MQILEFGDIEKPILVLIHGFQTPYQIWSSYIKHYEADYHMIVPILPGHNPNLKEEFVTIQQSVEEIENYIISKYGPKVYAMFGMSMGGVFVSKMWERQKLSVQKIILDGSPLVSANHVMCKMLTKQYLSLTLKTKNRDEKIVNQAVNQIIPEGLLNEFLTLLDNMSDETIMKYQKEIWSYKLPNNLNTNETEIHYFHGTKVNEMYAKKTAKYIKKHYPSSSITCFEGKGHCENSLLHPDIMIFELDQVL